MQLTRRLPQLKFFRFSRSSREQSVKRFTFFVNIAFPWWLPYGVSLTGLIALAVYVGSAWIDLETWDDSLSELESARTQWTSVQTLGLFPPTVRERAERAKSEYLHECVESLSLLRTAEMQLAQLSQTPAFSGIRSLKQAVDQLRANPSRLHFVSKPSAAGAVFRDQQYSLTHPCEIDLNDLGRLLVLLEGAPTKEVSSDEVRPILWVQDLKLERKETPTGHYLLDLGVIERAWKGRKNPSH